MKCVCSSLFFLLLSFYGFGQSTVDSLIQVGIDFHDNGQYESAIEAYNSALRLDPDNVLINYEIGLTMMNQKNYEGCLENAEIVLQSDREELHLSAILIKGSALDYLGKTKESIKLFEDAIEQYEENHLLYYNLGYNYYFSQNLAKAEPILIKAIETKSDHASSHLMLGYTMVDNREKIRSMLSLYFFLLLEPDTDRANEAFLNLREAWKGDITEGEDGNITINLLLPDEGKEKDAMSSLETMLSLLQLGAIEGAKKEKGVDELTAEEEFIIQTGLLFSLLEPENSSSEMTSSKKKKKGKKKSKTDPKEGFWWEFYVPFFHSMEQEGHVETFCNYILFPRSEPAREWLDSNGGKVEAFIDWLDQQ